MRRTQHTAHVKFLIDLSTLVVVAVAATGTILCATFTPQTNAAEIFCAVGLAAIGIHTVTNFVL